jgi:large subunit ribosomal protein L3
MFGSTDMINGILGRKMGMTQIFDEDGKVIPVTVIEAGPIFVTQVKTEAKDGYNAVQVGYSTKRKKLVNKSRLGHLDKAGVGPVRILKEFRVDSTEGLEQGQEIKVDIFNDIKFVDVSGTSKGRGFQGVIKRHGFHGGRDSHGSMFHRKPGSIGMSAWPSRVMKGKKLPGRHGNVKVTVQNLEVVKVDAEKNLLMVQGAIPGPVKSDLIIKASIKKRA